MGLFQLWQTYFVGRSIVTAIMEHGENQARLHRQGHDAEPLDRRCWRYSTQIHRRLAEHFPDAEHRDLADLSVQIAFDLLDIERPR